MGCPNVLLSQDLLDLVMEQNAMDELEEFAGASFLELGELKPTRDSTLTYYVRTTRSGSASGLAREESKQMTSQEKRVR
ncbi:hypothetical protein [Rathayibacter toxicus]|uniref:hypothetical protein n=1 Tax=Rathayibacter toxicus TaxID=145458 RepID=UPI001C05AD7B|nr:hypothetical protein [Rathayibacter toxicus]QWL30906.1 hypothetical protein E2R34_09240 [Rathayibacter toxicus]